MFVFVELERQYKTAAGERELAGEVGKDIESLFASLQEDSQVCHTAVDVGDTPGGDWFQTFRSCVLLPRNQQNLAFFQPTRSHRVPKSYVNRCVASFPKETRGPLCIEIF